MAWKASMEVQEFVRRGGHGCGGPKQHRLTALPVRNDEGVGVLGNQDHRTQVWAWGGQRPQASKRAPKISSFSKERRRGLNPHLGPGRQECEGRREGGYWFPFPRADVRGRVG